MDIKKILEEFNNFLGCDGQKEGQTEEDMVTAETAIEEKGEEAEKADMEQAEYKEIEPKKVEEETIAKNLLEEFSKLKEFYDVEPDQNLEMELVSFGIQDGLERFELDGIEFFKSEDETLENAIDVCVDEEFFPEWESENGIVSYSIDKIDYDKEEGKGTVIVTVFGDLDESLNEDEMTLPRYSVIAMNLKRNKKEGIGIVWDKDFDDPREAMRFAQEKGKEEPQHVIQLIDTIKDQVLYNSEEKLNESLNEDMDLLSKDATFRYMMLDRLRMDCGYFLGNGNRNENRLWAGSVDKQIQLMKDLYNSFEEKPEWLSMEEIEEYERKMKAVDESMNEISLDLAQEVEDRRETNDLMLNALANKENRENKELNKLADEATEKRLKNRDLFKRWKEAKGIQESLNEKKEEVDVVVKYEDGDKLHQIIRKDEKYFVQYDIKGQMKQKAGVKNLTTAIAALTKKCPNAREIK